MIRMLCGHPRARPAATRASSGTTSSREPERDQARIGYLSQRFTLYGDLTVDENIEFFAEIHGVLDFRATRDELLEFTRLTPFRRASPTGSPAG